MTSVGERKHAHDDESDEPATQARTPRAQHWARRARHADPTRARAPRHEPPGEAPEVCCRATRAVSGDARTGVRGFGSAGTSVE